MASASDRRQRAAREPLYGINLATAVCIEVFYSDRRLRRSGEAALVGFGGRADMGIHQTVRLPGRSQRATRSGAD
jgi:hypothetical protein